MKQLRTALSLARITQTFSIKSYIVHEPYKHWGKRRFYPAQPCTLPTHFGDFIP